MYVCEDTDVPKLSKIKKTPHMIKGINQRRLNCSAVEYPIQMGRLEPSNISGIYWLSTQDKDNSKCSHKGECAIFCL